MKQDLGRRVFITQGLALLGLGATVYSFGCAGGSSYGGSGGATSAAAGGNCVQNGTVLATSGVTEGHTHTLQLTAAEILAADPNAVFMTSSSGHTHPVQLTIQQYQNLQANVGITLNSGAGGDGHIHSVTINCN